MKQTRYEVPENESLREKQSRFLRMVCDLIRFAHSQNYELTFGHALRCKNCETGRRRSLHKERLAIDLNLFEDGDWKAMTSDHAPLGEYWESLSADAAWGGRFGDGNHYSLAHQGRR